MSGPTVRPSWHDAYDAQMALYRWYQSTNCVRWIAGALEAAGRDMPRPVQDLVAGLWDGEMGKLIDCDPIYVNDEMCAMVDEARKTFRPEPLLEWDLPTPRAFLWFHRPLDTADRYSTNLRIRAVSWSRQYATTGGEERVVGVVDDMMKGTYAEHGLAGPRFRASEMDALVAAGHLEAHGIAITLYCDREHYLTETQRSAGRDRGPEWAWTQTASVPVLPMHVTPWYFNHTFDGNQVDALGEATAAEGWWTLVQTALRLMMQRRPHVAYGRLDRPTRRAAARAGFRDDTEVLIVRLRKEEPPRNHDSEGEGRQLTHRHYRIGHWRNQWYPSERVHRQIRIMPTIVGDESLPLRGQPKRVFQWDR